MSTDTDQKVRDRAHRIWEREGRPDGRHDEHWAQAMHEIEKEAAAAGAGDGLKVTPDNDPSRGGGPVEGGPSARDPGRLAPQSR